MKFSDEFRDPALIRTLVNRITAEARPGREYRIMEFCGSHTWSVARFGLSGLLPSCVRLIHGPGCPVCVLPAGRIQSALDLLRGAGPVLASYGDVLRVPAFGRDSLLKARSEGADVRVVYSTLDALRLARENPDREVVFFAIGFETTAPATAHALLEARRAELRNFSVYCNHVLTPPAVTHILESPELRNLGSFRIDGFLGPAHVSAVIGSRAFEHFAWEYGRPVVISGFEPVDVLQSVLLVIRQVNEGRAEVENEYRRIVTREGNAEAQRCVAETFELRKDFEWRGLGRIPYSGFRIKGEFRAFDAEERFGMRDAAVPDHRACQCGAILRGVREPEECKLFGRGCTPESPLGPCMVSSEGACGARYRYRSVEGPQP